jgi:hypothetical protein
MSITPVRTSIDGCEVGDRWIEAIAGETLELQPVTQPIVSVSLARGPATVEGTSVTFSDPGEVVLAVTFAVGSRDLTFLAFEPPVLAAVPADQRSGRSAPRTPYERRLVLRSYANHGMVRSGLLADMRAADWNAFL